MGFETKVLAAVEEKLGTPHQAYFYNGTLCVTDVGCAESHEIVELLKTVVAPHVNVLLSRIPGESLYDFA